jgi:hypothetical protein
MKRVETANATAIAASSEQILAAILPEITALKLAVLKGNMEQGFLAARLGDVELQINQGREHVQVSEREGAAAAQALAGTVVTTARAVAETAVDAATSLAKSAPRNVWRTKLGLITAGSAAFVAIVQFFVNLPQVVRGSAKALVAAYSFIVGQK